MHFDSVLFLCVANSARSQMAEALARAHFGDAVVVQSAGSAPSRVNPWAVEALDELGLPTAPLRSKHVDEIDPSGVDLVITLCAEERCPVFLGDAPRLSWAMPDPDRKHLDLSDEDRLGFFRETRDAIQGRIAALAAQREAPAPTDPTPAVLVAAPDLTET
jgi:arsenate reductase (thioredoxin)